MKNFKLKQLALLALLFSNFTVFSQEQGSLTYLDSTIVKQLINTHKRFEYLGFSGYIQPQFQIASEKGAKSFSGGNFADNSNNRFSVRRGRIRIEYARFSKQNYPQVQFVYQFDCTERGVFTRDFWGKFYDTKLNTFALTTGLFARPFGYELNLGSSDRESPERGRMSQTLMKTERDIGFMGTFEPRNKNSKFKYIRYEIGLFNGQGLSGTFDYDSHKDLISRLALKPIAISKKITLSASGSLLYGGLLQPNGQFMSIKEGQTNFTTSDVNYKNNIAPRQYYGADAQLKIKNKVGFTEFRGEYISGTQSGLKSTTETPGTLPTEAVYIRKFDGAYFWFLQHLGSTKHQVIVKYDWYDPNKQIAGNEITNAHTWADLKYSTLGLGYVYYANPNLKFVTYIDLPKNESTQMDDYKTDVNDNTLTFRVQYRF